MLSDTRYLGILRQWVEAVSAIVGRRNFPRRAVLACQLALIEAVDNAIFHAHHRQRGRPIGVSISVKKDRVVVCVSDTGPGVGSFRICAPASLTTHGRGLFLIHHLMKGVESRMKNNRHLLRMTYVMQKPQRKKRIAFFA